ncbi:PHA-specific beta-ketothiolase [Thermus sp. CCB_US3_UF1]|uniref:thiolase family protein n=1 Tax=Thermus sp. CCB_US3_UF1 TaxID=1111069 RepID=UPI00023899CE|nr:thiolase family protein [Thermus sp. CCB_US3_UF1]AEV15922.1 PHA-specific beta-ketothiolase [Thermus sp. CCB_US3_UF1]
MREVYIVAAVRTPIGRFGGALKDMSPVELGAHAMRAALERAGVEGKALDLYVFGNVLRAGHGQLLPRQAALKAGIPKEVDGYAVDMVCASGMMAVMNAAQFLRTGEGNLALAGGMESMSQAGFFLSHRARWGYKFLMGAPEGLQDVLLRDGLSDPFTGEAMGEQAERLAQDLGVSRKEVDEAAFLSHQRAAEATAKGLLAREMAPIELPGKKGPVVVDKDEGIRPETTLEALAALKPAFKKEGVLTAGNASQISDGAAALLLASEDAVKAHGLKPLARILGGAWAAGEPWRFPEAPIPAAKRLLDRLGMKVTDFGLFENNEAFALNNVLFHRLLGVPYERLNVFGGAVALGHPIGASGARILVTLLNALEAKGEARGLAAICHGTGGSTALAVERV